VRDPSVLVVEDEENVRYIAAAALRLAGFAARELANGRDALRNLAGAGAACDLVVLDVMLPDVDGFEVCRQLRAAGNQVPIVFLTARDAVEDRLRGLTIGGDDYLAKPFSVEELVARVRVILRRTGRGARPQLLVADAVELDDDAHVVRVEGTEVGLSPTEYRLLRLLMRNQGRVLTRAQILDHVWDYDFDGESTVVETFISSLRKKVDPSGRLIRTVRGVGYRLEGGGVKLRTSLIMAAGFVLVVFTVASTLLPHDLRAADFGHHLSPELAAAILVGRLVVLAAVIAAGWWVLRRGLRPLAEVTRVADAIVADDRSRRVAVSVPGTEAAHLAQALNLMLDQQQATEDRLRRFTPTPPTSCARRYRRSPGSPTSTAKAPSGPSSSTT
jgi:two-component system OmpR family response regulator